MKVFSRFCVLSLLVGVSLPAQTPTVNSGGVVNAASFQGTSSLVPNVARGSIITIFGTNLSSATAAADRLPIPTQLPGTATQVLFDNVAAPLFYVSPTQINLQVPFELPPTLVFTDLVVRNGSLSSARVTAVLRPQDPGIFTLLQSGGGPGAILHPDGTPVSRANPVRPGGFLTIYATGLGAVNPAVPSAQAAPGAEPLARLVTTPTVRLAGRSVPVTYAGLAPGFVGLYQVNVQVPADFTTPAPSVSLTIGTGFAPTVSAGGPGLIAATPLTASTGSADLRISATGINLSTASSLRFGGRSLASVLQTGEPQTLIATVPAGALRVASSIPLYAEETGSFQSNSLNFTITGSTIRGSAPVLSNLSVTAPSTGSPPASSVSFDFQDPDGDIVDNGTSQNSAKIEFRSCNGSSTSTLSGSFLNRPDQTSGRVSFQLQFLGTARRTSGPISVDVTLIDQAGNRSNTITVTLSSWIC